MEVDETERAWRARWVWTGRGSPLDGATVRCRGSRIVSVQQAPASTDVVDLGDVVLLPGLVNAHAHLEFSTLAAPLGRPGMSLPAWIREVIAWRSAESVDPRAAVERGWIESLQQGTTTVGEIATGSTWSRELHPPLEVIAFHESIAVSAERVANVAQAARAFLDEATHAARWRGGLSPHAPYTVHSTLLDALVQLAAERQLPIAMHLAESREELELLAQGTGPFVDLLSARGLRWADSGIPLGTRPRDYLLRLLDAPRALVVHGNYLDADEITLLAQHRDRLSIVYCPRTHAFFGHEPYPLDALLEAGACVALGTDGRSSNPDLSLWGELRHLAASFPHRRPDELLSLATRGGAEALGLGDDRGALEPGRRADLVAVAMPPGVVDPWEALLAAEPKIARVVVAGREAVTVIHRETKD